MNTLNRERWKQLWQASGASGDAVGCLNLLAAAYSEPHRRYHNLRHIAECLHELESVRHLARDAAAVELSLWFHDAVYDTHASDNEEQSAALARRCLAAQAQTNRFAEKVARLVMATKHHDTGSDVDAPLIVDIDLGILGAARNRFVEYETQIRAEYSWVPEDVFKTKRTEVLESFLKRPRIYATDWFYQTLEDRARRNIEFSLSLNA